MIAVIFVPPTVIASIYGMNFKEMPELDWHWRHGLSPGDHADGLRGDRLSPIRKTLRARSHERWPTRDPGQLERREVIPERDRKIADIEEIARGEQKTALRPDPKNRHCADNTKRPLKEFVPTGSWSGSRTSKKTGCSVARHRHDATLTVRFCHFAVRHRAEFSRCGSVRAPLSVGARSPAVRLALPLTCPAATPQ